MFFGRKKNSEHAFSSIEINEDIRRKSTDDVLAKAAEILEIPEVLEQLEVLGFGELPNMLQRAYVPAVEDGVIDADKADYLPIVSTFPQETLLLKEQERYAILGSHAISLQTGKSEEAAGRTFRFPEPLIALAQAHSEEPFAPLVVIHELGHANRLTHPVKLEAFKMYKHFSESPEETEVLNLEAMVAKALVSSRRIENADAKKLFNTYTKQIARSTPALPVAPFKY